MINDIDEQIKNLTKVINYFVNQDIPWTQTIYNLEVVRNTLNHLKAKDERKGK